MKGIYSKSALSQSFALQDPFYNESVPVQELDKELPEETILSGVSDDDGFYSRGMSIYFSHSPKEIGAFDEGYAETFPARWRELFMCILRVQSWNDAKVLLKRANPYLYQCEGKGVIEKILETFSTKELGVLLVQLNHYPHLVSNLLDLWFENSGFSNDALLKEMLLGLELGCNLTKSFSKIHAIKYLGTKFSLKHCYELMEGKDRPVFIPLALRSIREILLSHVEEGEIFARSQKKLEKSLCTSTKSMMQILKEGQALSFEYEQWQWTRKHCEVQRENIEQSIKKTVEKLFVQFASDDVAKIIGIGLHNDLNAFVSVLNFAVVDEEFAFRCLDYLMIAQEYDWEEQRDSFSSLNRDSAPEKLSSKLREAIEIEAEWIPFDLECFEPMLKIMAKYFGGRWKIVETEYYLDEAEFLREFPAYHWNGPYKYIEWKGEEPSSILKNMSSQKENFKNKEEVGRLVFDAVSRLEENPCGFRRTDYLLSFARYYGIELPGVRFYGSET